MKIIDFDAKFFKYARQWVAAHPGLNEDQIEENYNNMMSEWIETPDPDLDGTAPARYFDQFVTAEALMEQYRGYHAANVNLPEPLYTRLVAMGSDIVPPMQEVVRDTTADEAMRTEAMGILRDIGDTSDDDYLILLVCEAEERNELSDLAADILSARDAATAARLMDAYQDAPEYAKTLILDIACNQPGDERVTDALIYRLKNRPEERALNASLLKKLGDPKAVEPLQAMLQLYELRYYDYLEIRDAVEALGGDAGEERTFYGDPDYEAMRNIE